MIRHHPDKNQLLEYAAGSLARGPSLVIAAHIQMCTSCLGQYRTLNSIGGSLLSSSPAQSLPPNAFEAVMALINQPPENRKTANETDIAATNFGCDPALKNIPDVLQKLLLKNSRRKWKTVTRGLQIYRLKTGQRDYEVAFHRLRSGNRLPEHDHRGKEFAIVLSGSFSDRYGIYGPGDFVYREPGQVHKPTATQDKDCLCFSAVSAPVAITGVSGWLLNPLIPFSPG